MTTPAPRLYFDLGSPHAYLTLERADAVLGPASDALAARLARQCPLGSGGRRLPDRVLGAGPAGEEDAGRLVAVRVVLRGRAGERPH
ncbi:MAG: hypothetical protein WAU75_06400, partial [Solirubrobacteraceae bacterium]